MKSLGEICTVPKEWQQEFIARSDVEEREVECKVHQASLRGACEFFVSAS